MNHISGLIQKRQFKYEVVLMRPDRIPLASIPYSDLTYTNSFRDFNTLNIEITRLIPDPLTGQTMTNPVWDIIENDYLIELSILDDSIEVSKEIFVVESPSYLGGDLDTKSYQCGAFERKYFNHKLIYLKIDPFRSNPN